LWKKELEVEASDGSGEMRGKVKVLDGEYKWTNDKGKTSSVHVLKNGEYVSCKEYYSSGELEQFFDYTKKCAGEIYGWCLFIYDKTGKVTLESWMCREKNGQWPKTRG
jgi:antitoxin component YwqK of YwqJK toxin-antitoxin module